MATINPVVTRNGDFSIHKYKFLTVGNGDTTAPISFAEWADRSVQIIGTFGVGGNVKVEGSNDDGTTWEPLTDYQGNVLNSITAADIVGVQEITEKMRISVTAGDGNTDLDVYVLLRRQTPNRA